MAAIRRSLWFWPGIVLLGLALSLASPARPAAARTFCGDFYIGLRLGSLPGVDVASIPSQALKLPFAGKLYYQDGMFRIDLDLPSALLQETAAGAATETSFPVVTGPGFNVYTLLIPLKPGTISLIDHSTRQGYSFMPPAEWTAGWKTPTETNPFEALKEPETIRQLAGQGVRIVRTGRIKGKSFDGLATDAYDLKMKVDIPKEALAEMPAGFKPYFTLRIYFERETGFPLEFSFLSDLFDFSFRLANIQTTPLPESLFHIPEFYHETTFTEEELMELALELATRLGADFGEQLRELTKAAKQPAEEGAGTGAEGTTEGETPAPAPAGEEEPFTHPAPGMFG